MSTAGIIQRNWPITYRVAAPERRTFQPHEVCRLFSVPVLDPWADPHQSTLILWSTP